MEELTNMRVNIVCKDFNMLKEDIKNALAGETDINSRKETRTLLMLAAKFRPEVVPALIDAGADIRAFDKTGRTALFYAVNGSANVKAATALIAAGADVSAKDKDGAAPIHFARFHDTVKLLVAAGADIDERGQSGMTTLMDAADSRDADLTAALLEAGADMFLTDTRGRRASEIAEQSDWSNIYHADEAYEKEQRAKTVAVIMEAEEARIRAARKANEGSAADADFEI